MPTVKKQFEQYKKELIRKREEQIKIIKRSSFKDFFKTLTYNDEKIIMTFAVASLENEESDGSDLAMEKIKSYFKNRMARKIQY